MGYNFLCYTVIFVAFLNSRVLSNQNGFYFPSPTLTDDHAT